MKTITKRQKSHTFMRLQIKASDDAARTFIGLGSAWDLDLGGDLIDPGAYKRTLNNWKASGRKLPLIDNHSYYSSVRAVVGGLLDGKETDEGLEVEFKIVEGNDGEEIYQRVKAGIVDSMSIGYEVMAKRDPTEEERRRGVQRVLTEIKLVEISLVIFPMNEGARIQSVKSAMTDARVTLRSLRKSDDEEISEDERSELETLLADIDAIRAEVAALMDDGKGLNPDDPERITLEEELRELELRALGTGI